MLDWVYLMLAIMLEFAASTCMKLSEGFNKIVPTILVFLLYGICYYFLALSLRTIDLSIAYAIWAGLGTVVVSIIGVVAFKEPINFIKAAAMGMIAVGVVILELVS